MANIRSHAIDGERVEIDVLARQGKEIREIARITGLARNTVRDVVRGQSDGQYGPRLARSTKLDEHKAYITDRIERAGDQRLPAEAKDSSAIQLRRRLRRARRHYCFQEQESKVFRGG